MARSLARQRLRGATQGPERARVSVEVLNLRLEMPDHHQRTVANAKISQKLALLAIVECNGIVMEVVGVPAFTPIAPATLVILNQKMKQLWPGIWPFYGISVKQKERRNSTVSWSTCNLIGAR